MSRMFRARPVVGYGGVDRRVVGDVVAIDDVVVPVALARLEGAVEAEGALPRTRLARGLVLGERELARVVVPGPEEVDGLYTRGDAEREAELSGRHIDFLLLFFWGIELRLLRRASVEISGGLFDEQEQNQFVFLCDKLRDSS
ncbi:hypothetical protein IMZ48_09785 [Candidatus Bathyarchaeota archaeon]|nr:hypothetical protein [Candidatus Bathyarchaeota archaeon]